MHARCLFCRLTIPAGERAYAWHVQRGGIEDSAFSHVACWYRVRAYATVPPDRTVYRLVAP